MPFVLFAGLLFAGFCGDLQGADTGPSYSAQSIVHSATQTVEALAPNTIATIYGTNLAFSTGSAEGYKAGSVLPTSLAGVTLLVNGQPAHLFFVSPTQINFLIPYELTAGTALVTVTRNSLAGPTIKVVLNATSPGVFPILSTDGSPNTVIATHLNGSLVLAGNPAVAHEIIVLYVAGLGRVTPDTVSGKLITSAASIVAASQLQITLANTPVPAANVLYAGLAPGFAGLYQINLRLPDTLTANPEIRVVVAGQTSQAQVVLPAAATAPPPDPPGLPGSL